MRNKKLTFSSIVVLFSLLTSLVFPTGIVLADDTPLPVPETPQAVTLPTEVPVVDVAPTEIPLATDVPTDMPTAVATQDAPADIVATATDIPTVVDVPTDVPTQEAPADTGATVSDVLSQVPAGTDVVVLNAGGEVLPLASQQAADIVAMTDPMWCPVNLGVAVLPGDPTCTINFLTPQALIDAMDASNPATTALPTQFEKNGIIYFTVNPGNGSFTLIPGTGNALETNDYNILKQFNLILQGGWNGTNGAGATFTGQTAFGTNPFTIGDPGNPWGGNITLNNFSFSGVSNGNAVTIYTTTGNITLDNVDVSNQNSDHQNNSQSGRYNTALLTSTSGNITVQNGSSFDGNNSGISTGNNTFDTTGENRGFSATTGGQISISDTTFQDAFRSGNTGYSGATLSAQTITLTNVTAQNNDGNGITISNNNPNSVTVNNSSFLNNGGSGFNTNMGNRPLALNNVSFSNNFGGAYNYTGTGLTTSCTAPKVWVAGVGCVLDTTRPTISAAISSGTLGSNNWYRNNVTVHFTCADTGGSGIASCPADQILTDGASVSSTVQTAIDNAGNVSLPSGTFTVKIDTTAPTILAAASPAPTAAGWNNTTPVTIHFTCTDGGSGIATCPADQLLPASGSSSATARATDLAGNQSNVSNVVAVKIDTTRPTISAAISSGTLGSNNWYRTNVTVHFTCTDNAGGSGIAIASCPADQVLSTSGSSTAQTVTDNAGNVSAPSNIFTVNIDNTIPTIVAAATTSPNLVGWYNSNVTVHFTCTDGGSGIAFCPADQLLTASGSSTAQTATDSAGNVSAASNVVTVQIDKIAPSASASATPAPNVNGWNNTNVTVNFSGTDAGSGIASCTAPVTLTTEGSGQSASGTCTDNAGNVSNTASANNIKIDKTNPVVTVPASIATEATSSTGAIVSFTASATDTTSGVSTPNCLPASGSNFVIGTTTVTCSVTDAAGNTGSNTFTVTVGDATAPVVTVPANITTEETSLTGADVIFSSSATDIVDGAITPTCSPASGSMFAVGTTTVTCSATDAAGNVGSASFVIKVTKGNNGKNANNANNGLINSFGFAPLLIPVTGGGQETELSCSKPSTTLEMGGFQVLFSNLCGYSVILTNAPAGSLLGTLPNGNKYVGGVNIVLLRHGIPVTKLPANATITLLFDIQSGMNAKNLSILFWDVTAKNGAGAWMEKTVTIENGNVVLPVYMLGTFVLVDKSAP